MRSILSGGALRLGGHRLKPIVTAALTVLLAVSLFFNSQLCYAISVNGETIGTAKDKAEAVEIVSSAEQQASEILGYDYDLEDKVTVSAWLGGGAEAAESEILGRLEDFIRINVLYIDGRPVAAAADANELNTVLREALERYKPENAATANFVQSTFINYTFADKDILQDMDELLRLSDPLAGEEGFRLDVKSEERSQYVRDIPFETEYYEDDTVYEGDTVVMTEGIPGRENVTECKSYFNGTLIGSEIVASEILAEPVTEVVAVGTMERPPTASTGEYIWPCAGLITSLFGNRSVRVGSSNHKGLDIASAYGTEIHAADGGEVTFAGTYSGYGNLVQITHDNGDITYYGHCSSLVVSVGERVAQGQLIAYMGATGVASGTHLHFEVRPGGGEPADPLGYLPDDGSHGYYL